MTRWKRSIYYVGFALLVGTHCSNALLTASDGGGSETINATVIVSDTVARFEADAKHGEVFTIRVFSSQYKPYERIGFADSLSADSARVLSWNAPYSGEYNFHLTLGKGKAAFVTDVGLMRGTKDTIRCGLKKTLDFKGRIASRDPASSYVLFIQGSSFYCLSDTALNFSMLALPSGSYVLKTRPIKGRLFMKTNDYPVNTDSLGNNVNITLEEK